MAIFPDIKTEGTIQIDDQIRIDASRSFVSKDEAAITLVEIQPEATESFVTVTGSSSADWFLDWRYSGSTRTVAVAVRVTTDGSPVTFSKNVEVLTSADDKLFSDDDDLIGIETDVLRYLPKGRSSFLNVHRKAQDIILAELDDRGITDFEGNRLTKDAVVDVEEVNKWSTYSVLWMIFQDLSDAVDDIFARKSDFFASRMNFHRDRSFLRLDLNGDGNLDLGEIVPVRTTRLLRG